MRGSHWLRAVGRPAPDPRAAPTAAATDWRQILHLYDQLLSLTPSPVVALNRAVAVAEVEGPNAALALVDDLDVGDYDLLHAIRADLLRRLGRNGEAVLAYEAAIARTETAAERDFLRRMRQARPSLTRLSGPDRRESREVSRVDPETHHRHPLLR